MDHVVPLTKETMVEIISQAKFKVIYKAPAMDQDVANEVVQFVRRTGIDGVAVSLDLSAEVYREGFGDSTALDILYNEGITVKHIQGMRVGVLLVDDKAWVFSPLLKLTPRHVKDEQNNAITADLQDSMFEGYALIPIDAEPVSLFGDGDAREEIGSKAKIEQLTKALRAQPSLDIDLQRLRSEYKRLLQFVEITFKGARLGQITIKIPNELLNVTKRKGFEAKMKASYPLFNDDFLKVTKPLKDQVDELRERYTHALSKKYGRVILVQHKAEFEKGYRTILQKVEQYKRDLHQQINEQIQRTKQELIDYFTPVVMENPPEYLLLGTKKPIEEQEIKSHIDWLLGRELPTSEQILKRIEFYYVYKELTEEILQEDDFYRELEKAFKDEHINWPHQRQNQVEFSL